MTTEDICDELDAALERDYCGPVRLGELAARAAAELRQTRETVEHHRLETSVARRERDEARKLRESDAAIEHRRSAECRRDLRQSKADLAAAVELLKRVRAECGMSHVLDVDTRAFLDALAKRSEQ